MGTSESPLHGFKFPDGVTVGCVCAVPDDKIVHFFARNEATLDAIGPGKIGYQVTMSKDHSVNVSGLQAAIEAVGATPSDPLRFCFAVPDDSEVFSSACQWARRKIVLPASASHLRDSVQFYAANVGRTVAPPVTSTRR